MDGWLVALIVVFVIVDLVATVAIIAWARRRKAEREEPDGGSDDLAREIGLR